MPRAGPGLFLLPGSLELPAEFHRVFDSPQFVENVCQRPPRMEPGHPRAGEAHHDSRPFSLCGFVTMNRAIGTSRLVRAIGTLFQPSFCVLHELCTIRTKAALCLTIVVMIAINMRHANQRFVFALQSAAKFTHDSRIAVFSSHLFDQHQYSLYSRYLIS